MDPEKLLFKAGVSVGETIADLGAGSGHYATAAAKIIGPMGKVYVVDVQDSSLEHVMAEARLRMAKNITTIVANLDQPHALVKIPDGTCDMVLLANILHQMKDMKNVLSEVFRILKTQGKVLVVDWNDNPSAFGPKGNERVSEEDAKKIITSSGFKFTSAIDTDQYHYGLIFIK
jgi:ubiquinone/menaquinone biosynthesis C-methylase UbiE